MSDQLEVRVADEVDADAVAALVERAYRGESSRAGWTSEADYVGGSRTSGTAVRELITDTHTAVLLGERDGQLVACCQVTSLQNGEAYLGMLAVEPTIQNGGLGRRMVEAAERVARERWAAAALRIHVLSVQSALADWYRRLGFVDAGDRVPFPAGTDAEVLVAGLDFLIMTKQIASVSQPTTGPAV